MGLFQNSPRNRDRNGCCACFRRGVDSCIDGLISETALRFHLFIYAFYCLYLLFSANQNASQLDAIIVMLISISIACAVVAISAEIGLFLFPFIFVTILLTLRAIFFCIINFINVFDRYTFRELMTVEVLHPLTLRFSQMTEMQSLILIYALICLIGYHLFVLINVIFTQSDLNAQQRHLRDMNRIRQRNVIYQRLDGIRQHNPVLLNDVPADVVERNADSPPLYSLVIREPPRDTLTAKDETSPPRYSQLGGSKRKKAVFRARNSPESHSHLTSDPFTTSINTNQYK